MAGELLRELGDKLATALTAARARFTFARRTRRRVVHILVDGDRPNLEIVEAVLVAHHDVEWKGMADAFLVRGIALMEVYTVRVETKV
jgi:hypothetical protein